MLGWMKHKLGSRLWGGISVTSDTEMTPPLWQKLRGLKGPLEEDGRGEWRSWIKIQHSKNEDHGFQFPHFMPDRWGKNENSDSFMVLDSKITVDGDCIHEIKRHLPLGRKAMINLDSILKSRDIAYRGPYSQGYGFPSSCVWVWELDNTNSWALKNGCFWTGVGKDSWESLGLQGDQASQS